MRMEVSDERRCSLGQTKHLVNMCQFQHQFGCSKKKLGSSLLRRRRRRRLPLAVSMIQLIIVAIILSPAFVPVGHFFPSGAAGRLGSARLEIKLAGARQVNSIPPLRQSLSRCLEGEWTKPAQRKKQNRKSE